MDVNFRFAKQPHAQRARHVVAAADSAVATVHAAVAAVDIAAAAAAEIVAAAVAATVATTVEAAEIAVAVATKTVTKPAAVVDFWRPALFGQVSFFWGWWWAILRYFRFSKRAVLR